MMKLNRKTDCCGCGACAQVCPRQAINLVADEEGFAYPKLDLKKCIDCGLCEKVCPQESPIGQSIVPAAYAAYLSDQQLRQESSSGGIFSALALWILNQGGVVFGAALAEDLSVRHICVESDAQLYLLRGSKYVQSDTADTFREAKALLEAGRRVLYSGVACQIAGLKRYLQREYDNLYTVDVLCHGVPSPLVWKAYLQQAQLTHKAKVCRAFFREKSEGWKRFQMRLEFEDGRICTKGTKEDLFLQCFLANICLRPSCHACRFKGFPRPSDLSLGDAWGIEKCMPEMDDDGGTSVVLIHTGKGQQMWDAVKDFVRSQAGTLDTLLPPGADSRRSVRPHPNRSRFFAAVKQGQPWEKIRLLLKKPLYHRTLSAVRRWVILLKK